MAALENVRSLSHSIWTRRHREHALDLLVVQTRELSAAQAVMWIRLRLLGLSGQGTSNLHASGNAIVRRLTSRLQYSRIVEIHPLALPATAVCADASYVTDPVQITLEPYEVEGRQALQVDIAPGERLNVEPADGYFSLAWTTALPVESLVQRLGAFLNRGARADVTIGSRDGFHEQAGEVSSALEQLGDAEHALDFWRIDLDDRTFTWERREIQPSAGGPAHGLMGFIGDAFDARYLEQVIEATATPTIGANVVELLSRCDSVIGAARVPRHALAVE